MKSNEKNNATLSKQFENIILETEAMSKFVKTIYKAK